DQFFSRAALTSDQDRRVGRRDATDQFQRAQELRVFSDKRAEIVMQIELIALRRVAVLARRARGGGSERHVGGLNGRLGRPGLGDEIGSAGANALRRQVDRTLGGDQNDGQTRLARFEPIEQFDPFFTSRRARKVHVLQDELEVFLLNSRQRLFRRRNGLRAAPGLFQQQRERRGDRWIVVNNQDHKFRQLKPVRIEVECN